MNQRQQRIADIMAEHASDPSVCIWGFRVHGVPGLNCNVSSKDCITLKAAGVLKRVLVTFPQPYVGNPEHVAHVHVTSPLADIGPTYGIHKKMPATRD